MYSYTKCPFNPHHTFAEEKYYFHINRCKDGKKVQHLYTTCKYHSLHIIKKQDVEAHQLICQHRKIATEYSDKLMKVFSECQKIRVEELAKVQKIQEVIKYEEVSQNISLDTSQNHDWLTSPSERAQNWKICEDKLVKTEKEFIKEEEVGLKKEEEQNSIVVKEEDKSDLSKLGESDMEKTVEECEECSQVLQKILWKIPNLKIKHRKRLRNYLMNYRNLTQQLCI